MGFLVNIDNGGTFTDACVSDGTRVVHAKAPTTPHDLTQCFIEVLQRASILLYGEQDLARLIRETARVRQAASSSNAARKRRCTGRPGTSPAIPFGNRWFRSLRLV